MLGKGLEKTTKHVWMVTLLKYSLTFFSLCFLFYPSKPLPPHPIPTPDQISIHSGEAHNRGENRANHKLLCLCFVKAPTYGERCSIQILKK